MATYLDKILRSHREEASRDSRSLDSLITNSAESGSTRGFAASLTSEENLQVIAEVKRRSPSRGDLFVDLDPAELARTYEHAGASCVSVLTDEDFFGGSVRDLRSAREAVALPVIRKDFTVSANDVADARIMGADCVLLIVAALDDAELADFSTLADELGMDALIEVHDEAELQRALNRTSGSLIGVNQRDLLTFEVDQERAVRVGKEIPDTTVKVAESGVRGPVDAKALAAAGYHAVLVGEHLVTAEDPSGALNDLLVPRH